MYVYNMYVLFFKMPDNEQEFGSVTSEMNVSELNLEEAALEVYLFLLISFPKTECGWQESSNSLPWELFLCLNHAIVFRTSIPR